MSPSVSGMVCLKVEMLGSDQRRNTLTPVLQDFLPSWILDRHYSQREGSLLLLRLTYGCFYVGMGLVQDETREIQVLPGDI